MMVSYTRARSEGLGIENKGGLMQKAGKSGIDSSIGYACAHYELQLSAVIISCLMQGIPFHVFETMSFFLIYHIYRNGCIDQYYRY